MITSSRQQRARRSERLIEEYILQVCNILSVIFVPKKLILESEIRSLVRSYFEALDSDVRNIVIHDDVLNTCINILDLDRSLVMELNEAYGQALIDLGLVPEKVPFVSPEFDNGNYEPSLAFMSSEPSVDSSVMENNNLSHLDSHPRGDSDESILPLDIIASNYLDEIGALKYKVEELTDDNESQSDWIDDADRFLDEVDDFLSAIVDGDMDKSQIEEIKASIKSLRIDKPF